MVRSSVGARRCRRMPRAAQGRQSGDRPRCPSSRGQQASSPAALRTLCPADVGGGRVRTAHGRRVRSPAAVRAGRAATWACFHARSRSNGLSCGPRSSRPGRLTVRIGALPPSPRSAAIARTSCSPAPGEHTSQRPAVALAKGSRLGRAAPQSVTLCISCSALALCAGKGRARRGHGSRAAPEACRDHRKNVARRTRLATAGGRTYVRRGSARPRRRALRRRRCRSGGTEWQRPWLVRSQAGCGRLHR
jgi:hypothetical protein